MINEIVKLILSYPGTQFDSRWRVKTSEKASKGVKSGRKGESNGEVASDESQVPEDDPLDLGEISDNIKHEEKEMDEMDKSEDEELGEDEVEQFKEALCGKVNEVAASAQPACLMLTKDVPTRWNSSYDMLKFLYHYQHAIDRLTSRQDLDVRKYELTNDEWEIVKQLRDTLKVFKNTTLKFSSESTNLPDVIPAMDQMHDVLTSSMKDPKLNVSICGALSLGIDLLNKYYSLTDESEVYWIAIILHPSYKLRYFKKASWDKDWITAAKDIVWDEFKCVYAEFKLQSQASCIVTLCKPTKHTLSLSDSDDNMGAPLSSENPSSSDEEEMLSELNRYLKSKTLKNIEAPLAWWYKNHGSYPCLWRMACDYLTIPATSVAVEHVFSKGQLIISHIRNRLSGQSTRALLCLGAWTKQNLVKSLDLIEVLRLPDVEDGEEVSVDDYPIV
ncbi:hypothetical protein H1R20_g9248, partial [Candolleomyces eurysporus]